MIEAIVTGKLFRDPVQRTSNNTGRPFVTAMVSIASQDADGSLVKLVAFSDTVRGALLSLKDGDSIAVAGTLKVGVWTAKDGCSRPALDMVVTQVMSLYALERRRKQARTDTDLRPQAEAPLSISRGPDHRDPCAAVIDRT